MRFHVTIMFEVETEYDLLASEDEGLSAVKDRVKRQSQHLLENLSEYDNMVTEYRNVASTVSVLPYES